MNLTRLNYFLELAECKNITHTAAKLYMAQSNLSKQISMFEEEVGAKLFIRHPRGVELTIAGQMLYDKLKHIPSLIETTCEHARNLDTHWNFRIGILEGFDFTRERFTALQKLHPDYQFFLERRSYENLFRQLQGGKYDAIITMGWHKSPLDTESDLLYQAIRPLEFGALIRSDHPLSEKTALADLVDIPFVSLDPQVSPAYYQMLQNVCRLNHAAPRTFCFVEDFEDLLLNVETRMTVGIMAGNNGIRAKSEIKTLPIAGGELYHELVCWDKSNRNPLVQSLIKVMQENSTGLEGCAAK